MNELKGLMFGQCMGDAVGLITEFQKKGKTKQIIFPYEYSIRDWPINDWTDDSDCMILLFELIIDSNLNPKSFAKKIQYWKENGFPELGDKQGRGIGGTIINVVSDPNFLENPQQVAYKFWINSGKTIAANGALMRTAILSFSQYYLKMSEDICKVTHADPRCIASCLILNKAIRLIGDKKFTNLKSKAVEEGIKYFSKLSASDRKIPLSKVRGIPQCWTSNRYIDSTNASVGIYNYEQELIEYSNYLEPINKINKPYNFLLKYPESRDQIVQDSLSKLELDNEGLGYTYKCLGCAMWAMDIVEYHSAHEKKKPFSFKKCIKMIVLEAGDADTNAAVVGAVLGTYLGYNNLYRQTEDWIKAMPNTDWLLKKIARTS